MILVAKLKMYSASGDWQSVRFLILMEGSKFGNCSRTFLPSSPQAPLVEYDSWWKEFFSLKERNKCLSFIYCIVFKESSFFVRIGSSLVLISLKAGRIVNRTFLSSLILDISTIYLSLKGSWTKRQTFNYIEPGKNQERNGNFCRQILFLLLRDFECDSQALNVRSVFLLKINE